jgi:IS30 family transposase
MGFEELKARFFEALEREQGSVANAARTVGVNRATA